MRQIQHGVLSTKALLWIIMLTHLCIGREFYFNVNGIKMYSKGSNSIPIHVLPEKITKESTKWLLDSAKKLHSNMIRVWGGGMYESDYFYDVSPTLICFIVRSCRKFS
jgi:hypothetical protein